MIHYSNCPVCHSAEIEQVLIAKDHTVSGEEFPIMECKQCSLRFTQDVPEESAIGPYYQSENYISHSNTSSGIINRVYLKVRKRTLKQKRKLIERFTNLQQGVFLDVGSGTGSFVNEMRLAGWKVTGLEPDASARAAAKNMFDVELQDVSLLNSLAAGSFDAISLWHVLEHVHDLHGYVKQLRDLLKSTGKLFVAVPNYTSFDAISYKEKWAAYDVPRHLYHFSPRSMQFLVEKHGLKIKDRLPMWYDSFYVSILSSKYKNGKTNIPAAVINGFCSNLHALSNTEKCSSILYVVEK